MKNGKRLSALLLTLLLVFTALQLPAAAEEATAISAASPAIGADVGVMVLAVLNATRALSAGKE